MNHYTYDEIEIGHEESFSVEITEKLMKSFCDITGDVNPLHTDLAYAKSKGYDANVCYGMLTASFLSTMAGVYLPGERSLIHRVETDFNKPVFVGDKLTVKACVQKKMDPFRAIVLSVSIVNQDLTEVCRAKMRVGVVE